MIDDKSNAVSPDIRFYLNNYDLTVEFVSMSGMFDLTVLEQGKRWTYGTEQDISRFIQPKYSIWTYDWNNEDDTPGSGAHIDPANEIEWEIELVQRWMKGEELEFSDLVQTCDLVGIRTYLDGVEFVPREEAVIFGRYGIHDGVERHWQELADQLGVSPKRVKEVAAEALEKLISFDESLVFVCSSTSSAQVKGFELQEVREISGRFWKSEISHYEFTQLALKLDTICYLYFLFILSDYFNMENPGLLEVPEGSLEVASNIDLLLGTLSRRMLSSNPHNGFSQSENFDLRQGSWGLLTKRAVEAEARLQSFQSGSKNQFADLSTWTKTQLLDCLALSLQVAELRADVNKTNEFMVGSSPICYFLSQQQLEYWKFEQLIETELHNR